MQVDISTFNECGKAIVLIYSAGHFIWRCRRGIRRFMKQAIKRFGRFLDSTAGDIALFALLFANIVMSVLL